MQHMHTRARCIHKPASSPQCVSVTMTLGCSTSGSHPQPGNPAALAAQPRGLSSSAEKRRRRGVHLFVIVWTWGVGDGMCDERRSHICRMEWCNGGVVHSSCQCNYDINATSRRVGDRRPGHPQIGAFGIIIHEAWHSTRGGMCARGRAQHHGGKGREGRGEPLRRGHKAGAHHQNVGLTLWETPNRGKRPLLPHPNARPLPLRSHT